MIRIFLIFLVLWLFYNSWTSDVENFCPGIRCRGCPMCLSRTECPTRNMSYDIRGEAYFPLRRNFPFDNSVLGPSNCRCYPKRLII